VNPTIDEHAQAHSDTARSNAVHNEKTPPESAGLVKVTLLRGLYCAVISAAAASQHPRRTDRKIDSHAGGKVTPLDLIAKGKFPLEISFTLADGRDTADAIPPQGSRGWLRGYLK
jgi:hypothetical protein